MSDTDRIVDVNGSQLCVRDTGGDGPTLLFIHGSCGWLEMFDPQLEALGDRYRCIAYDQRGHGRSSGRGDPVGPDLLAADAIALCDALGVARCFAVGVSLGGVICQVLGLDYPDRLLGLVLASTTSIGTQAEGMPPIGRFTITLEMARAQIEVGVGAAFQAANPDVMTLLIDRFNENDPATLQAIADGFTPEETAREMPRLPVPNIVVVGDEDPLTPISRARDLAASTGGALHVLTGIGHLSNLESPVEFNRIVGDFVDHTIAST